MLGALIHVFILKEQGALTAEQRDHAPEEEQGEHVERPEPDEATEDDHELVARQLSIIQPHFDQKLVTS